MTLSEQLAQYMVDVRFDEIPQDVVQFTKLCIVDYYSSLLKGQEAEPVRMMEQVAQVLGGEKQARAVTGLKTSITNAAFINGGASPEM